MNKLQESNKRWIHKAKFAINAFQPTRTWLTRLFPRFSRVARFFAFWLVHCVICVSVPSTWYFSHVLDLNVLNQLARVTSERVTSRVKPTRTCYSSHVSHRTLVTFERVTSRVIPSHTRVTSQTRNLQQNVYHETRKTKWTLYPEVEWSRFCLWRWCWSQAATEET